MKGRDRVLVGEVVGVHGVKGVMKWRAYTEDSGTLMLFEALWDEEGERVEGCRSEGGKGEVLRVVCGGVENKEQAESWVGKKLYVERDGFPAVSEDEVYYHDFVGLRVVSLEGKKLGVVVGIEDHGAGAIIEWRREEGGEELHPYADDFFGGVDREAGEIEYKGDE